MASKIEKQFQELFKVHYEPLCQFVLRYVKDQNEAEDIVQAVFSTIWSKREKLEWGDKITHYLYKATKNNALDHLKRNRLQTGIDDQFFDELSNESGHTDESIESIQIIIVKKAIQELPPKCRQVFKLQKLSGMTYKEVAKEMGISVKTVENQMIKALASIRDYYNKNKKKYGI